MLVGGKVEFLYLGLFLSLDSTFCLYYCISFKNSFLTGTFSAFKMWTIILHCETP